ncbi:MAG: VCBS repeat-containing protein [Rhizobacter sp.]|nr:VCBS repeat-containing protein [Bacteriovorax sp.]
MVRYIHLRFLFLFLILGACSPEGKKAGISFHFKDPTLLPLLDAGNFKIGDEAYFYNAFYIDRENARNKVSAPLFIHHVDQLNLAGSVLQNPMSYPGAEHIRHLVTLATPWGPGVLFADHGVDYAEFNSGGMVKLLVKNDKDNTLADFSGRLNQKPNFVFNVAAPKRKGQKFNDILLISYNTPFSKIVYLQATTNGYVDKSEMLPANWFKKEICFMTGTALDIDHDETDEVLLGGCDLDVKLNPSAHDRIIKLEKNKWVFQDEKILPVRKGEKGWGTVFLLKEDFNQDGFTDIVALTHDLGFHQGQVQVMYYDPAQKIFSNREVRNWPQATLNLSQHYLHRVVAFDIDKDGKKDIIGQFSYIKGNNFLGPKIFVLLNKGNYFEYQTENILNLKNETGIIGIDVFKIKDQKEDSLMISYYNSSVDIF